MNILLISNMYPSIKFPAFGSFIQRIENNLCEGDKCTINRIVIDQDNLKSIQRVFVYFKFVLKSIYAIFKQRHDIVYIHFVSHSYIPLLFLPKFLIRKLVINFHGTDLLTKNKLFKGINAIATKKANLVIVPSAYFKELVIERLNKEEKYIFVSPSGGVSKHFFNKSKLPLSEVITCGFVGRITDRKGWKIFVIAISELKQKNYKVRGVIVGPGNFTDVNEYVREMNVSNEVDYLGVMSNEDLPSIYEKLDLFIFPTLFDESLGLVPLEAMANSIPSICSNFNAVKSYIDDGCNGYLFEKGNTKELVEKIIGYVNLNQEEKEKLRQAAYEKALKFKDLNVGLNLYNEFIKL